MPAAAATEGSRTVDTPEIEICRSPDLAALEAEWRSLEAAIGNLSFFQSWTWMGCLIDEQFGDPVLIRAHARGKTVGLALFNRRGRRLHLGESGDPLHNTPFIEHNAPLVGLAGPAGADVGAAMLAAAWSVPGIHLLALSGVPQGWLATARGHVVQQQERIAPLVDLAAIRTAGSGYLATRSANTRYQLRRSLRRYAARGPLVLSRAATPRDASEWLDALIVLHSETWRRRGKPGAFEQPFVRRFHEALVQRALARDELDLLRLTAGGEIVGYLYNFRLAGRISAYQSGLAYSSVEAHEKPGLSLHTMAIERALQAGDHVYDFLAGADRYKQSLATGSTTLVWAQLARAGTLAGIMAALWHRLRRLGEG